MVDHSDLRVDALIFGGGIAGLWTLDELTRQGYQCLLLEKSALGEGQTISSQGIIHGGMKYSLAGAITQSAKALSGMPEHWRACFDGSKEPDLREVTLLSDDCIMWRTKSLRSKAGFFGAKVALSSKPQTATVERRPDVLEACSGEIVVLDDLVIDTASVLASLSSRHRGRIVKYSDLDVVDAAMPDAHLQQRITDDASGRDSVTVSARVVILLAGGGNSSLRRSYGMSDQAMQRRPLHMVLLRGSRLSGLFGHCVDGTHTRITVTSTCDSQGRTVWQIGGKLAEDGVRMSRDQLIDHACRELKACIPQFKLDGLEMATYTVDRAEAFSRGRRPSDSIMLTNDSIITGWPTKLALTPILARDIASHVKSICKPDVTPDATSALADWARPEVAAPPWETAGQWTAVS